MQTSLRVVTMGLVVVFLLTGCDDPLNRSDSPETTAAVQPASASALESREANPGWGRQRFHCPDEVPAALNPPADATLQSALSARGVQIYTCAVPAAGGAPAFALKAPHAVLSDGPETKVIHFAGPSWQALDGSLVTATRLAGVPAPDATAIPWLLLQVASHAGSGVLGEVTFIQRLDTEGGLAPATGCDATHLGSEVLVPYRANYFFYRTATAGAHIRQCAAR